MPPQSALRLIKRWRRYERRGQWAFLRPVTRGVHVLYKDGLTDSSGSRKKDFRVVYIGVAGVAKKATRGIGARLRHHDKTWKKSAWTHYSFFEVHDNVSREELLELESLFLAVFRHDSRIPIENQQRSSTRLARLRKKGAWQDGDRHRA